MVRFYLLYTLLILLYAYATKDANDSKSVTEWFEWIYNVVGKEDFKTLFPLLLTDNGSEFSNPTKIERIQGGDRLTNVFYCYPYSAFLNQRLRIIMN